MSKKNNPDNETTLGKRRKDYEMIVSDILKNKSKTFRSGCLKTSISQVKTLSKIRVVERIGAGSIGGEAYLACYPYPGDCAFKLALKVIPLDNRIDLPFIKQFVKNGKINFNDVFQDEMSLNFSNAISEIFFMELAGKLVKQMICPNLPLYYGGFICNECEYSNKKLNIANKNCFIIPNELAEGDLKSIIEKSKVSVNSMRFIFLQIFMGLYSMKKYFDVYHNDLHYGNVLFRKTSKNKAFKYNLGDYSVTVPTTGFLMILWDFGYASIKDKITNPYTGSDKKSNHIVDFSRIISMISLNKKYYNLYKTLYTMLNESKTMEEFIKRYVDYLNKYIEDYDISGDIEEYDLTKNVRLEETLNTYRVKNVETRFDHRYMQKFFTKTDTTSPGTFSAKIDTKDSIDDDVVMGLPSPVKSPRRKPLKVKTSAMDIVMSLPSPKKKPTPASAMDVVMSLPSPTKPNQ